MNYRFVVAIFLLVLLITFAMQYFKEKRKKKFLESLRASWGVAKEEFNSIEWIQQYFLLKHKGDFEKVLEEQVCNDIDFEELFNFANRTTSMVGQQYLYDHLRKRDVKHEELLEFDQAVAYFSGHEKEREQAQIILNSLSQFNAFYLTQLIFGELTPKPKWYALMPILFSMTVISILMIPIFPPIALATLFLILINSVFHYLNKRNVRDYLHSFPQLLKLLKACIQLRKMNLPIQNKHEIKEALSSVNSIKRSLFFVSLDDYLESDEGVLGWFVIELFKSFFLVEVLSFYSALKALENKRNDIQQLFDYVGYWDTVIATGSLRKGLPVYCKPVFTEERRMMKMKEVYHPLIEDCVTNDLEMKDKSILLTGSNMSGKTTFVRTLAINNIFAQTLYTCFAKEFQIPLLNTYSAIRISDNLMENKSYYFEEVLTIRNLIDKVDKREDCLFIIDELFKGTNTIERVAGAKAVLSYLNQGNNLVIASTHDIELAELLKEEYDLFHFTETIEDEKLIFDYKLKPGKLTTRNAIRILELNGYPEALVSEARTLS